MRKKFVAVPAVSTSRGSQHDLATDKLPVEDVLELWYDEYAASDLLISEDCNEDDIFVSPAQLPQPRGMMTREARQLLLWPCEIHESRSNIPFLELSAVFHSLRHFLLSVQGHHVLVRTTRQR